MAGSSRVTNAVLQVQIEQLSRVIEEHDRRGRDDWQRLCERLDRDHDLLTKTESRVSNAEVNQGKLEIAHGDLVRKMDHLRKEARALGGLSNLVAAIATALAGLSKTG